MSRQTRQLCSHYQQQIDLQRRTPATLTRTIRVSMSLQIESLVLFFAIAASLCYLLDVVLDWRCWT
jgi:hypothetical protein